MTKVKICGITNLEDALLAAKFGADALGFNFYPPSPRYVSSEKTREIVEQLPEKVLKVGVFVNESLGAIAEIASVAKLGAIQLHGEETPEFARQVKTQTNLEIIKAFRVSETFKPEDVLQYEVDAVLLDAYSAKEHGGTGETFDWEITKKIQEISPKMYLAGGLSHENVGSAIWNVKPFAVDVCSGVEEEKGRKDKVALINFIVKAKRRLHDVSSNDFYDFLSAIQQRPTMYFGRKSLTDFNNFIHGFGMALSLSKSEFSTRKFFPDFDFFVRKQLNDTVGAHNWCSRILYKMNSNEEEAFDLFFALLEEFKLEIEDLSNE